MNSFLTILFTTSSLLYGISISGSVYNSKTPVHGAKVELRHGNWQTFIEKNTTNKKGFFNFNIEDKSHYKFLYLSIESEDIDTLIGPIKHHNLGQTISVGRVNIRSEYYIYAKEQRPELFEPKDEFETTSVFKKRKKLKKKFLNEVKKDYKNILLEKQIEAEELAKRAKEGTRIKNAEIIKASIKPINLIVENIGQYNADIEQFSSVTLSMEFDLLSISDPSGPSAWFYGFEDLIQFIAFENAYGVHKIVQVKTPIKLYNTPQTLKSLGSNLSLVPSKSYYVLPQEKYTSYINVRLKPLEIHSGKIILENVQIPLNEAKSFKKNKDNLISSGITKRKSSLEGFDYYNILIKNPDNEITYYVGDWNKTIPKTSNEKLVPPELKMKIAFIEANNNGFLDAKESGEFKIELSNTGLGTAKNVDIILSENKKNKYLKYQTTTMVGNIKPGKTVTKRIKIAARNKVKKEVNTFIIKTDELNGFSSEPIKVTFETFPFIPPELAQVDYGIETAEGTNIIKPGIETYLQVRVQNQGNGEAKDVSFTFNKPSNLFLSPDSKTEYSFNSLKQGEFKDLDFKFFVNKKVTPTVKIIIDYLEESTEGQFEIELDIKKPQQSIHELVIRGKELQNTTIEDVATISVDVEKNIPETRRKSQYDLAIVFGIESYKDVPGVSFARRDAVWMKEYFQKTFNIPSNRIYTRTDADVGQAEFRKVFSKGGWIDKRIKKDKTNIFFYFAGHGAPNINDNKGYLIPYDGDPNYASQTGYSIEELYKEMNRFSSKSATVFLDACFSGVNRNNEMLLANARPVFLEVDESYTDKVNVFSAAESKQISSSWPEKKHGLFSYFLMKGLKGDADFNKDKKLTFGELGRYLKENVSSTAGLLDREQTPSLSTQNENKIFIQY